MADGWLDPASAEYRLITGLIDSARRRVGAEPWTGRIGLMSSLSMRRRSRSEADGSIHLNPREVIAPLMQAQAGKPGSWMYPRAARDAAYTVIYEGLRQSSPIPADAAQRGGALDRELSFGENMLDQALAEQRTYEIAQEVMAENGLADAYSVDPPEAALAGQGLNADMTTPFRLNPTSASNTAAVKGLVDTVAAAGNRDRDDVFGSLITHDKTDRWAHVFRLVTAPADLSNLTQYQRKTAFAAVSLEAGRKWSHVTSMRRHTISTIAKAEQWGYSIGVDTAAAVIYASHQVCGRESARPVARQELSPTDVLGAQAPFTGVKPPGSTPAASTGQSTGAERPGPEVGQ
ncbi:hypothetical protein AB0L70_22050 [Kribbella sp. NPDC051952]|uniref:hypothetical protein n=1 Tax=Kribbella sp. NPDC051952 TaxID=3154851 RepID=UPI00343BE349